MKYYISNKHQYKKIAHLWNEDNTHCKMLNNDRVDQSHFDVTEKTNRPICKKCFNHFLKQQTAGHHDVNSFHAFLEFLNKYERDNELWAEEKLVLNDIKNTAKRAFERTNKGIAIHEFKYSIANLAKKTEEVYIGQIVKYAEKVTDMKYKGTEWNKLQAALDELDCYEVEEGKYNITNANKEQ